MPRADEKIGASAMEDGMRFEMFREHNGDWRWRLRTQNGNVIADSAEGYRHREDCENGIRLVKSSAEAPIVDMTTKVAGAGPAG